MRRNIALSTALALTFIAATHAAEPRQLFNGKDLTGWEGDSQVWKVEDGAIVGHTAPADKLKHNTFLIWKDGKLGNFKLTVEYKLEGGNSGIQYRSKVIDPKEWIVGGYQADMDGDNKYTGILYEERGRGIVAGRGEEVTIYSPKKKDVKSIGNADELAKAIHSDDWNTYVVEANGNTLKHTINGKLMSETIDEDTKNRVASGILALQVHAGLPKPMTVRYRSIKLEELEDNK